MEVIPFLRFDGDCRAAMEFYQRCFEAELFLLPYADATDRILHATLSKGGTLLKAADQPIGQPYRRGDDFAVMLQFASPDEQQDRFAALSEDGAITMPLQDTFWNARFGMLTDKFGVRWMLNCPKPPA